MQIKVLSFLFLYLWALPTWSAFGVNHQSQENSTFVLTQKAETPDKEEVRLILWNIYKEGKKAFLADYKRLIEDLNPNTLLFQEAYLATDETSRQTKLCLPIADCIFSSAFHYDSFHYGVLTSSQYPINNPQTLHSDRAEPLLKTPKTSLVVEIKTPQADILVINTHGINFVSLIAYDSQLKEIIQYAQTWQGPIIWAGDFNSWNPGRVALLRSATEKLGLKKVQFNNKDLIKGFLGFKLDHAYYRELKINEAKAVKTGGSDHNALFMSFSPLR